MQTKYTWDGRGYPTKIFSTSFCLIAAWLYCMRTYIEISNHKLIVGNTVQVIYQSTCIDCYWSTQSGNLNINHQYEYSQVFSNENVGSSSANCMLHSWGHTVHSLFIDTFYMTFKWILTLRRKICLWYFFLQQFINYGGFDVSLKYWIVQLLFSLRFVFFIEFLATYVILHFSFEVTSFKALEYQPLKSILCQYINEQWHKASAKHFHG